MGSTSLGAPRTSVADPARKKKSCYGLANWIREGRRGRAQRPGLLPGPTRLRPIEPEDDEATTRPDDAVPSGVRAGGIGLGLAWATTSSVPLLEGDNHDPRLDLEHLPTAGPPRPQPIPPPR